MLEKNSADDILIFFRIFPRKIGIDISCKLSLKVTICMKGQDLLSGENKIFLLVCRLSNLHRDW